MVEDMQSLNRKIDETIGVSVIAKSFLEEHIIYFS